MRYHFVVAVWGAEYVDFFLKVGVAHQLVGGLEAYTQNGHEAVYKIYTKASDIPTLEASPLYQRLSEIIPTQIHTIPEATENTTVDFSGMTYCHSQALQAAWEADAAVIFLSPDVIWAQQTFTNLLKRSEEGYRVVLIAGVRVTRETFLPLLKEKYTQPDGTMVIAHRELMALALDHLHPITLSYQTSSPTFNARPSHLAWLLPGEALLLRAFHQHPLLIHPRHLQTEFGTIDYDFFYLIRPLPSDYYVVQSSDEIAAIEFSPSDYQQADIQPNRFSIRELTRFSRYHTFKYHRRFVRHAVWYHAGPRRPRWRRSEIMSGLVVYTILLRRDLRQGAYWAYIWSLRAYRAGKLRFIRAFRFAKRILLRILRFAKSSLLRSYRYLRRLPLRAFRFGKSIMARGLGLHKPG